MSMSTHVYGFRPPDKKWEKMRKAWQACVEVGIDPPVGVQEFFNFEPPDAAGVTIREKELIACGAVRGYSAEMASGYEVDVAKLPPDVKVIRFVNSW